MNSSVRNAVLWLIILCLVVLVWARVQGQQAAGGAAQVLRSGPGQVKDGKVDSVIAQQHHRRHQREIQERRRISLHRSAQLQRFHDGAAGQGRRVKVEKDNGGNWVSHPGERDSVRAAAGLLDFHDAADAERAETRR